MGKGQRKVPLKKDQEMKGSRYNSRHDSLVVAEQKNAERNEYTRKVSNRERQQAKAIASSLQNKIHRTYRSGLPTSPRDLLPGDMMAARIHSAREIRRVGSVGISIASLSMSPS